MSKLVDIFIVILVAFLISLKVKESFTQVGYVTSKVDGKQYLVRSEKGNEEVADLLARINVKIQKLLDILRQKNSSDPRTQRLIDNYDPKNISEGTENEKFTSYSINKGEKVVFCLRARDGSNDLVDENTLTYVAIHELGHLATTQIGHEDIFWKNFKWLLKIATDNGLYKYVDYNVQPQKYCGLTINSNVLNHNEGEPNMEGFRQSIDDDDMDRVSKMGIPERFSLNIPKM
jgi:hypothetical protein